MDFSQCELCFVCDKKILNKGICLCVAKTYFTKTAFPTKISQLIGDSFVVVVSGEDKLCERCAALINRSDKLEVDLLEIKREITEFLNYKYNLSTEEEHLYTPEDSENSKVEDDCKNFIFMDISPKKISYSSSVQEENQHTPSIDKRPHETNEFRKCDLSSDVAIKSEPSLYKYQDNSGGIDYAKKPDKELSGQFISKVLLKKFPESNSVSDQKLTVLNPFFSKPISGRPMSQLAQEDAIESKVKRETISSEYNFDNSTTTSTRNSDEEEVFSSYQSNLRSQTCITEFSTTHEATDLSLLDEKSLKYSSSNVEKDIPFVGYPPETNLLKNKFKVTVKKPEAEYARNHLKKDPKTAPQCDAIVSEVKRETVSTECNFDNPTVLPTGTCDEENIFNFEQSNLGSQICIAAISTIPEATDFSVMNQESSENSLCNIEKEILFVGYPPQRNVLNKEFKITLKKPKPKSGRNHFKKDKKSTPHAKLRPILPKATYCGSMLASLNVPESCFYKKDTGLKRKTKTSIETFNTESTHNEHIKTNNSEVETPSLNNLKDCSVDINTDRKFAEGQEKSREYSSQYESESSFVNVYEKYLEKKKKNPKKELLKHQKVYKCSFCQKSLKTRAGLQNHKAVHTGKFSFYCDFCGQGFVTHNSLIEHRSSHTKEERFMCDVCGKKFSFQSTYWIHRKWHDNPFPYKCNDCGRLFKHSSLLSVHKRKHTGERPYKCSYCSLTFTVSNSLKRHLILHTKEYPFHCDACKQGFTTRFKWTEHLAKMHKIFIDKPPTDKKDYKVAVYDNEEESKNEKQIVSIESSGLENNEYNTKDTDISIPSFPDYLCESIVEIVLENSTVLSEHSLTLSDSWLT